MFFFFKNFSRISNCHQTEGNFFGKMCIRSHAFYIYSNYDLKEMHKSWMDSWHRGESPAFASELKNKKLKN